jgi:hypothetical protein
MAWIVGSAMDAATKALIFDYRKVKITPELAL